MLGRLGVAPIDRAQDGALLVAIEQALAQREVEIDRFFFDWRGGARAARLARRYGL